MRRSGLLLLALAAGGAVSAGAQNKAGEDQKTDARRDPRLGTVSTSAVARTRLPNTVADVVVGIETVNPDQQVVTKTLVDQSTALMAYLKTVGAERLRTGQISVDTQTHTAKNGQESIVGYTGRMTVSFRVPAEKLGEVVTGALSHGANKVDETSLTARESEMDAARKALAVEATKTAIAEGEAVAAAAESRVLGVKEISVGNGGVMRPQPVVLMNAMRMKSDAMPSAPMAVAAGDEELSVNVSVTLTVFHDGEPE